MKDRRLWKLVQAALFAALTCVATMVVQIPVPATGGYLNLGDAIVLLGALLLGPWYGFAAGSIGSMLADLLSGYAQYAIGTLLIKGASALLAALLWAGLQKGVKAKAAGLVLACIVGECVMVAGYFVFEALALGYGMGALPAVPGNLIQGAAGVVLAAILYWPLARLPHFKNKA